MMIDNDRVVYDALLELVTECNARNEQPRQEWLVRIRQYLAAHPEWIPLPPSSPVQAPPPPPAANESPRAMVPLRAGERIQILVDDDMKRVVDSVLKVWSQRACVFQAGGKLCEVQTVKGHELKFLACDPTSPRLLQVTPQRARMLAAQECSFGVEKFTKDGPITTPCLPPEWLGSAITTLPDFPGIPVLAGIAQAPTLRRDGALIWEKGYDCSTGLYVTTDLKVSVPENPTQSDARNAMQRLLDLVADFDFVNAAGRSAWASGVLSIACRHAFDGPAPIVIIDAAKKGAGKTTLADVASIITTGTKAPRMFYSDDEVEMDKRITALALAGEQIVLIDNIVGKLSSPPLDAALTSTSYRGRVLGKSEMTPALPMKICWFATGNGLIVGGDIARRALFSRLEPSTDHPEDRTGPRPGVTWRYPDLLDYASQNRAELLSCALIVVKAYICAGRPNLGLKPMGSFERWSATIRSAMVWAGADDPCLTIQAARDADLQDFALRTMLQCWPVADDVEVTAASLIEWANLDAPLGADPSKRDQFEKTRTIREQWRSALLEWLPAKRGDLPTARELGYALRSIKGSVIGEHKIEADAPRMSGIPWKRTRVGAAAIASSPPASRSELPFASDEGKPPLTIIR